MVRTAAARSRPPAVAGLFYPADADRLHAVVRGLLDEAEAPGPAACPGIIVPHAGYVYSGGVAAAGFACLRQMRQAFRRAVVIGPAHYVAVDGLAAPSVEAFETPLGSLPLDRTAVIELAEHGLVVIDDHAHQPEHSLEVELPFLQVLFGEMEIIPLVAGRAAPQPVAATIAELWDAQTLLVISTDLSHYHAYATARRLDAATAAAIEALDGDALGPEGACGYAGLRGALIEVARRGWRVERCDLRNSGDTAGGKDRVVGYGAWAIAGEPA